MTENKREDIIDMILDTIDYNTIPRPSMRNVNLNVISAKKYTDYMKMRLIEKRWRIYTYGQREKSPGTFKKKDENRNRINTTIEQAE